MKLFYLKGSCSLAPHIILHELNMPFDLVAIDPKTKQFEGGNFVGVNPKGSVPVIEFAKDQYLTEGAVILQYLADQRPTTNLAPKVGSIERYRLLEWLNFIATELHKGMEILYASNLPEEFIASVHTKLAKKFEYVDQNLKGREFIFGDHFSIADAYLFTVLSWNKRLKIDLTPYTSIVAYVERIKARPSVQTAMKAEGLS